MPEHSVLSIDAVAHIQFQWIAVGKEFFEYERFRYEAALNVPEPAQEVRAVGLIRQRMLVFPGDVRNV